MDDIFSYLDYQRWIRDSVEELKRHKPIVSWRYVAGKVGIDAGNLLRISQGKTHLGTNFIHPVADFFKLTGRQRQYFEEMVYFGRAKTDKETLDHFEKMQSIRGVPIKKLSTQGLDFYQNWYNNAVRSLVSITPIKDEYALLGRMCSPPITAEQAEESVKMMADLGMLVRGKDGCWEVTELFVSTGQQSRAEVVREFQRQTLALANESAERHSAEFRDLSTVTMTLNSKEIPALRERIKEFRGELLRFSQEGVGDDSVMQLNIQLFPIGIVSQGDKDV
ncbi:MAG: TIGR02147 family protein [Fibrobacter sp.]|nr:TIGR02147 family protein [Fibrobacter sp.]